MGGGQALQIGLTRLDLFAYIGSFSGAIRNFDVKTAYGGAFPGRRGLSIRRCACFGSAPGTGEQGMHNAAPGSP